MSYICKYSAVLLISSKTYSINHNNTKFKEKYYNKWLKVRSGNQVTSQLKATVKFKYL